jgi:hypothetical protein
MLPGTSNSLFHVDVPDDRGNRIVFKMQKAESNSWKIVTDQPLPNWISDYEKSLNDMIESEMG